MNRSARGDRPQRRGVGSAHSRGRGRVRSRGIALLQSRGRGLRRGQRRAGRRGRTPAGGKPAGSRHSRLDASRRVGARDLPQAAREGDYAHAARDHGDGARRGGGACARPHGRGGRLCRQALLRSRTDGTRACSAQAKPPGADRRSPGLRRHRPRPGHPERAARRARSFILAPPNSGCSNFCWRSRAGCSPGPNCSTAFGGRPPISTTARSMCMSVDCARSCQRDASAIRFGLCAASATRLMRPTARRRGNPACDATRSALPGRGAIPIPEHGIHHLNLKRLLYVRTDSFETY